MRHLSPHYMPAVHMQSMCSYATWLEPPQAAPLPLRLPLEVVVVVVVVVVVR